MIRPLLIIGVGGAGGKTIRAMKQELNRILESSGYTEGLPDAWQFLHIDTTYDGVSFPAPMLPANEFHCVVPSGASFHDLAASITNRGTVADQQKMLSGWGVPNSPIPIRSGAGQNRAIGRQVGVAVSSNTLKAIQNSISNMLGPSAQFELAAAARALGARGVITQPEALIFSSLGGGTGSGMFTDIAELLKRSTPQAWAIHATSFLYTPEVFADIGYMGAGIPKNTLGALNELVASRWVGLSDQSELLYTKMGLVASNTIGQTEFGCRTNILMGAKNTSTGFDIRNGAEGFGMDQVFLTTGQAIAGIVSNEYISDLLFNRIIPAIWSCRAVIDTSGLAPEASNVQNPSMAASAIGFGKLSLGVEHIIDYVSDAMTKHQVKNLLWPELSTEILKEGVSILEVIQEKADEIWPNFLLDSGLDVRGSQNQIIDALLPEQTQERIKLFIYRIIKKNVSTKARPLATFSKAIWSEWETEANSILWTFKSEISGEAQKWVPSIQEKLRDQISHELALNGYAVLINLTERLEVELRDHVLPELLRDHNEFSIAVSGFGHLAFIKRVNELADGLTDVSTQNGPFFEKLSQSLIRVLEFQINSHVNALAASLVQDMLNSFVIPLKEQLNDSRFTLQEILKSNLLPNGSKNPYLNYPDWASGVVPNRYKARTIERTLIDSVEYESTYEFYASKDSQGAPAFQQSVSSALLGKKMNPMPGDVNPQTLITVSSPWITSVRDAQGTMGAAVSKTEWNFHTDIEELSERNRRWLKHEDSTFGKFTNISIRDFVGAAGVDPQIRDQREARFVKEFQAMVSIARPLITLNPNAMSHVLSVSDGEPAARVLLKTSKIPFAASSFVGRACTQVLQQSGFNPSDPSFEQDWFAAGSNDTSMVTVSTIQNPLPVWAFASLTEPILEEVARSKNQTQTWVQFWDGRRSRPLVEAVPFETEMRRSIVTGWFLAGFFGLREIDTGQKFRQESISKTRSISGEVLDFLFNKGLTVYEDVQLKNEKAQSIASFSAVGRSLRIWNPTLETPDWSTFPSPLLNSHPEDMKRESWLLPQLLMSAGIALANFGKTGNPEFINGYRLLKYIGREVTTSFSGRDQWDGNGLGDMLPSGERSQSSYLKNWVELGDLPSKSHSLNPLLCDSLIDNPIRSEALITAIEKIRSQYTEIWASLSDTPWHSLPETWELREDIDLALSDISEYVRELHFPRYISRD